MTAKIDKKITGYRVKPTDAPTEQPATQGKQVMHEAVKRPESLTGSTYKVKPPHLEDALYITINDIILNEGTEHEERRPFEIFINSKNMEHYEWVVALTRLASAVFRKGGEVAFIAEELQAVFSPKGGYFHRGRLVPSLVAEIGAVIERHLVAIGVITVEVDEHMQAFIESKREELADGGSYPASATVCGKCGEKAVVVRDGCAVCLSCGDSKCG